MMKKFLAEILILIVLFVCPTTNFLIFTRHSSWNVRAGGNMLPKWAMKLPWDIISENADFHGIDPYLVASIIQTESSGNVCVTRYEDHWKYFNNIEGFAKSHGISKETEKIHQKTSFGLMQVMGGLARDLSFKGHLVELCNPYLGIEYGCKNLKRLSKKYSKMEEVISAYNAGSPRKTPGGVFINDRYVDTVLAYYTELTK